MITLTRKEMQQVLDALYSCDHAHEQDGGAQWHDQKLVDLAYELLRARLAEKEQEPVAWMHTTATGETYFRKKPHDKVFNPKPVYTTLPQREWQGLTDDEIHRAYQAWFNSESKHERDFVRAIEAKLREKNK